MDRERLERQFDFIKEIDKEKFIQRQTKLSDGVRRENDAEHAWHMAIMTVLLSEYANEKIDVLRTVTMLLIHDIVEIDAGDTYAYSGESAAVTEARERKAAERVFGILPEDQGKAFRDLWEEFEAYQTPEAKFAHVLDNCQPMLLNDASNGLSWTEHQVRKSQIYKRNEHTAEGSRKIWNYMQSLIQKHINLGHVIDDSDKGED